MATVTGPRISWPRRAVTATVFLIATSSLTAWVAIPSLLAGIVADNAAAPVAMAHNLTAAIAAAPFVIELARILSRMRTTWAATETVRHLRRRGGTWWEAGHLVAAEEDPISAGRLVGAALSFADDQCIGLVALPANRTVHRAYVRRGFVPGPVHSHVLIRPPLTPAQLGKRLWTQ